MQYLQEIDNYSSKPLVLKYSEEASLFSVQMTWISKWRYIKLLSIDFQTVYKSAIRIFWQWY